MALSEELSKKLTDAHVSAEAIAALGNEGYDTEAALRGASKDDLKEAGVAKGGDRSKIKELFPSATEPTVQTAPGTGPTDAATLAKLIEGMGTSLATAMTAADRDICPHCNAVMPKGFSGKNCTKCGRPMKRKIVCVACGTANEQVKDGDYCSHCGEALFSGEARQQITYLIRVKGFKAGPAVSELARLKDSEKDWERFVELVQAWVDEGGYADMASYFHSQSNSRYTF